MGSLPGLDLLDSAQVEFLLWESSQVSFTPGKIAHAFSAAKQASSRENRPPHHRFPGLLAEVSSAGAHGCRGKEPHPHPANQGQTSILGRTRGAWEQEGRDFIIQDLGQ